MPTNTQHITPSELKDMLPQKPERMNTVEEPKRQQLVTATYDVVGCLHEVYRQLGPGLPEYIYQEALAKLFSSKGIPFKKEQEFHPSFLHGRTPRSVLEDRLGRRVANGQYHHRMQSAHAVDGARTLSDIWLFACNAMAHRHTRQFWCGPSRSD